MNLKGSIIASTLLTTMIAFTVILGLGGLAANNVINAKYQEERELAFQIAEAGIDYYRWHLAHSPEDYQDGTTTTGPYIHDFEDKNGDVVGTFTLEITPPATNTTAVVIKSTGKVSSNTSISRTIETKLAIPSIAKYAVSCNSNIRFGEGTEIYGMIHSNGGIRFDGLTHNIITSAKYSYNDPDHTGKDEWGVHTHLSPVDPLPDDTFAERTDIFEAGRLVAVPAIDFAGITADFAKLKTSAQNNGIYLADSGELGYHFVLKTNDSVDIYKVTKMVSRPPGCTNTINQDDWGVWSIDQETFVENKSFPINGIVFAEDDVWMSGQINTAYITIAAARLPYDPSDKAHIIINNDLLYTNYDGKDVIGLIAQGDITVGMVSELDLRIDAAMIAQTGRVGRFYYKQPSWWGSRCQPYHVRDKITLYGSIATHDRYGFAYTDDTGYAERIIIYDSNLLYNYPPGFPLTSDQYETVYWKEIK